MIRKVYLATMLIFFGFMALYAVIFLTVVLRHAPAVIWEMVTTSVPGLVQLFIEDPMLLLFLVPACVGFWIYAFGFPTSETNDNVRRGRHMTSLEEIREGSRSRPPSRPQRPPQRSQTRTSTVKQPNRQQRSRRK